MKTETSQRKWGWDTQGTYIPTYSTRKCITLMFWQNLNYYIHVSNIIRDLKS